MEKIELVEVESLSYWYPGRETPAVADVSFTMSQGEFVLVVGPTGSGKSSLLKAMNGLVPRFFGGRMSGSVRVCGLDTTTAQVRDIARKVGMVFQDPENQLVTESPESEVAFGPENLGLEPLQMKARVEEVLATLRLTHLRDKRLVELSGGEKQKVALASVLVMHPEVLVLDEPTSQLDPVSADDFLATLRSLNDDLGLAVLLSEHRIDRCLHFADRVLVMREGKVEFDGSPLQMARWSRGRAWVPVPPVTALFSDQNGGMDPPLNVKECRERIAESMRVAPGPAVEGPRVASAPKSRARTARRTSDREKPLVETRRLHHVYEDGTIALTDVTLKVFTGESVAVVGENGSGKTTLVKHFNGLLKPTRGTVLLEGRNTSEAEVAELARTCGMLGQNPNHQLLADTTEGELEATLDALGVPRADRPGLIEEVLDLLELSGFRRENPIDLSCGERERVSLASVLVYKPRLLVLDEPTRGVDGVTKARIAEYMGRYRASGGTLVLVTHDMELAAECCDRVVLMAGGRVLADGDRNVVLSESLFFTTQFSKSFRGMFPGVVTRSDAERALWGSR